MSPVGINRISSFINPKQILKSKRSPLKFAEFSKTQDKIVEYEYKSKSKLRKFFSFLLGDVVTCTTESGFQREARISAKGVKRFEKKIYPNNGRVVETIFEADGKTPKNSFRYDGFKIEGSNYTATSIDYNNGRENSRFQMNSNNIYELRTKTPEGIFHFEAGNTDAKTKRLHPVISYDVQLDESNVQEKFPDGAIIHVKAKDMDKFRGAVRKKIQNYELNTGVYIYQNPFYRSFKAKFLKNPEFNWASKNLEVHDYFCPPPKGSSPDDIIDVYVLRSERAFDAFAYHKDTDGYYRKTAQRYEDWFLDEINEKLIREGVEGSSYDDPQFKTSAKYLGLSVLNNLFEQFTKDAASQLKLKHINYEPKVK